MLDPHSLTLGLLYFSFHFWPHGVTQTVLLTSKLRLEPSTVAHTCNPNYSRSREQEDRGPEQNVHKTPTQLVELGMVVHAYLLREAGSINKSITDKYRRANGLRLS
jgi:hypothetical protein